MACKRGTRRAAKEPEDLSKPTSWRMQHGRFAETTRAVGAGADKPLVLRRAVDTLGAMLANGTITPAMHRAGIAFRAQFRAAALDTLRTTPLLRMPSGATGLPTERQLDLRRKVAAALDALGGQSSAAGCCVWHVVGYEASVREWAMRQGWRGKPVGHSQAQGILVAALGVLAGHYGRTRGGTEAD
jgi:hypothetical protein